MESLSSYLLLIYNWSSSPAERVLVTLAVTCLYILTNLYIRLMGHDIALLARLINSKIHEMSDLPNACLVINHQASSLE